MNPILSQKDEKNGKKWRILLTGIIRKTLEKHLFESIHYLNLFFFWLGVKMSVTFPIWYPFEGKKTIKSSG